MINQIVNYNDISKLAAFSRAHNDDGVISYIKELKNIYEMDVLLPVVKAFYYSHTGRKEYKELTIKLYEEFPEFKFFKPYYGACYHRGWEKYIISQENIVDKISNLKESNLCTFVPTGNGEIKDILHNIWTIDSFKSDEEKLNAFTRNNLYQKNNYEKTSDWQHIMWLGEKHIATSDIVEKINDSKFLIKFIDDLVQDKQSAFLISAAKTFSELGFYLIAANIVKFLALKNFGGVYIDGDYRLFSTLDNLANNANFVVGHALNGPTFIESHFIGSKKNHIILDQVINLLERNILAENAPDYALWGCRNFDKTANFADAIISVAIANTDDFDKRYDLILPRGISHLIKYENEVAEFFSQLNFCPSSYFAENIGIIGRDSSLTSWAKVEIMDYQEF